MKPSQQPTLSRREFLRGTLASGAGAALLIGAPGVAHALPQPDSKPAKADKQGYRLTPHIAAYYQSAAR